MYAENYKLWQWKLKNNYVNGEICHVHGLEDSIYLRYQTLPKMIYKLNVIPIKISGRLFVEIKMLVLKYIGEGKRHRVAKTVLKRLTP